MIDRIKTVQEVAAIVAAVCATMVNNYSGGFRGYLAPGRTPHGTPDPSGRRLTKPGSLMANMAARLKRAGRRSRYRLRQQTVEPVIGQIKHARGFRQFLLRGFSKVQAEWALVCTAHNLTKLVTARTA